MVTFSCGNCGDAIPKQQAAQHINNKCRGAKLSCVDCAKEFAGSEFKKHSQCVTEAEKYSKKGAIKSGEPTKVVDSESALTKTKTSEKKKKTKKSRTAKKTKEAKKARVGSPKEEAWQKTVLESVESGKLSDEEKGKLRARLAANSLPFKKAKIEAFVISQFPSEALQTKARKIFDHSIKLFASMTFPGRVSTASPKDKKEKKPKAHSKVVDSKKNVVKQPKGQKNQEVKLGTLAVVDKVGDTGKKRQLSASETGSGDEGSLAKKGKALGFAGIQAKNTPVMLKAKKGGKVTKGEKFGAGKQRGQNNSRQKVAA